MNIQEATFWAFNFFINPFINLFLAFNYQFLLVIYQLCFTDRQESKKGYLKDKEFTQGHFWSQKKTHIFQGSFSLCFCQGVPSVFPQEGIYFYSLAIRKHPYSGSNTNFIVTFGFDLGSVLLCPQADRILSEFQIFHIKMRTIMSPLNTSKAYCEDQIKRRL